jgi:hypothetical protein
MTGGPRKKGWQTGSQRFRKRVVRERPDILAPVAGQHAYELSCTHVVFRERRAFGGVCYCEICRRKTEKPGA